MFLRFFKRAKARLCPRAGRRRGAGSRRRVRGVEESRLASRRFDAADALPSGGQDGSGALRRGAQSGSSGGKMRSRGTEVYRIRRTSSFGRERDGGVCRTTQRGEESCGGRRAVFRSAGIHSAGCGLTSPVSQSSGRSLATPRLIKDSRSDGPPLARRRLGEPPAGRGRRRRRWPRRCGARRRHPARAWRAAAGRAARVLRVRTGAA